MRLTAYAGYIIYRENPGFRGRPHTKDLRLSLCGSRNLCVFIMDIFTRTKALIGEKGFSRLSCAHVLLCGCGGVGSYTLEALVRAGIGKITVIDSDTVDITNLNRQIIATYDTIGMPKTAAAEKRALSVNPKLDFSSINVFLDKYNISDTLPCNIDYIVDAIDFVPAKVALARYAQDKHIPIISCLGTGNRLDASRFRICDIYGTSGCPLARKMRYELKRAGVERLTVLHSDAKIIQPESNFDSGKGTVGSISYVPSAAGLLIAQHVITQLLKEIQK